MLFFDSDRQSSRSEYVYDRLNDYNLSHILLMRQMADLSATPIASLAGDQVVHHLQKRHDGNLILNVGIDREHGNRLLQEGADTGDSIDSKKRQENQGFRGNDSADQLRRSCLGNLVFYPRGLRASPAPRTRNREASSLCAWAHKRPFVSVVILWPRTPSGAREGEFAFPKGT